MPNNSLAQAREAAMHNTLVLLSPIKDWWKPVTIAASAVHTDRLYRLGLG